MIPIAHIDVDLTGAITLGELIVGIGTLALAGFTWRLAIVTSRLDTRAVAREEKRREREIRGVARLIDAELEIVAASIEAALRLIQWRFERSMPHEAWDRYGSRIAEVLSIADATAVIGLFLNLAKWAPIVQSEQARNPTASSFELKDAELGMLTVLRDQLTEARPHLQGLASAEPREP